MAKFSPGYESSLNPYSGSLIGRFANRIAAGTFEIDGVTYHVTLNTHGTPPVNQLHGGAVGWDKVSIGYTGFYSNQAFPLLMLSVCIWSGHGTVAVLLPGFAINW